MVSQHSNLLDVAALAATASIVLNVARLLVLIDPSSTVHLYSTRFDASTRELYLYYNGTGTPPSDGYCETLYCCYSRY